MTEHSLILRARAAQATLDEWKVRAFRLGEADCARLTASHLRRLGHRIKLPPARSYRTVKSAEAALDKLGLTTMADALDALGFERIAPAAALVGDIIQMPGDPDGVAASDRLAALTVALGNGRVVGWHPDAPGGAVVMQPLDMVMAWRVEPKGAAK
ncbi:hypothetical protein FHW96_000241 [Novosphingobium sp. SG751A]|uniref:DUF6950 family protein n=1 Tax=Novosphingobium sp. SG751A TaxID=2587000 RepID=UPI0015561047|nr:hypothetical protein [Novosphingobium sp. SG751A]NOW44114.1 hypothetical protein [Novosphingobium sp. SG751A]